MGLSWPALRWGNQSISPCKGPEWEPVLMPFVLRGPEVGSRGQGKFSGLHQREHYHIIGSAPLILYQHSEVCDCPCQPAHDGPTQTPACLCHRFMLGNVMFEPNCFLPHQKKKIILISRHVFTKICTQLLYFGFYQFKNLWKCVCSYANIILILPLGSESPKYLPSSPLQKESADY